MKSVLSSLDEALGLFRYQVDARLAELRKVPDAELAAMRDRLAEGYALVPGVAEAFAIERESERRDARSAHACLAEESERV